MACVTAKCVCPICCGAIVLLFISSLCVNWEYSPRFYDTSVLALPAERRELQWSDPGYLAMCLIVKDQPLDVLEWIEYHRKLGATKFYVFDHNSTVPLVKQLYAYIEAGVLEYQYFREYQHESKWAQSWVYDSCIARFASYHRWMAFIDTDEFIVLNGNQTYLPALLQEYEQFGGLAINWRLIGSSGHIVRPIGGMLRNYNACLPLQEQQNNHIKTIANTRWVVRNGYDPHTFVFADGYSAVDEDGEVVPAARTAVVKDRRVSLYHYVTRSLEDFSAKVERGPAHGHLGKTMEYWNEIEGAATDTCPQLQQLVAQWTSQGSWYF